MIIAALVLTTLTRPIQEPPEQPSRRLSLVAQSSTNRLEDIAVNKDETRILTHDREYAPRLWDRKTMRLLRVLDGHSSFVNVLEFSADGEHIVTASGLDVFVWDSALGRKRAELVIPNDEMVADVAFSSDGKHILVGLSSGQILICDTKLKVEHAIDGLESPAIDIQCALGADIGCAGGQFGRAIAFTLDGRVLGTYDIGTSIETGFVLWARIDRRGKHMVVTTLDEKAHLIDIENNKKLRTYDHYMGTKGFAPLTLMSALFVGRDGDQLLVAEESGAMRLYDVATGNVAGKLEGHTAQIREIRQTIDGTKVATYGDDGLLKIWDAVAQKELPFTRGPGNPTAGEFSLDGSAFWLGFSDGSLRRHDTNTGAYDSEAVGTTAATTFAANKGRWMYYQAENYWIVDLQNQTSVTPLGYHVSEFRFSPNGEKAVWKDPIEENQYYLYDLAAATAQMRYLRCLGAEFTRDSKQLVTWHSDGSVYVWNTSDGESAKGWNPVKDKPRRQVAVSPTDDLVVSIADDTDLIEAWNYLDGTVSFREQSGLDSPEACAFSNDGKRIAVACKEGIGVWSVGDATKQVDSKFKVESWWREIEFSPDGRWIAASNFRQLVVLDAKSGNVVYNGTDFIRRVGVHWSPDSTLAYIWSTRVYVFDPVDPKKVTTIKTSESVGSIEFSEDGKRLLTTDSCDGLVVWELPGTIGEDAKRMGSFVQMKSETESVWLATDKDGRYDATDPADVSGAHYVLEWSGGLETIAVEQLKSQFYEPGLLAKLLGLDTEPARDVPSLDALKLYPSLDVTKARSGALRVTVEERDDGGAGVLRVWVNGKLVHTRNNPPGFFEIEPATFDRYFLPSTLLPNGQGNSVRVSVTNKSGDLESPPVTVDVGVPADLKPPEVSLYALFVGIGDYVGTAKDLSAPASDAKDLERAVRTVAEKLLPGRVKSTLLATEPGKPKPTRDEILKWFDDVYKASTSSDIVVVFFAGHGVNQIAGAQDYFFLTPEADPTSVSALTASTAAISGSELAAMLSKIPASKQVVILDTCHSGAFAPRALEERSVSGDYRRAWQAIRDATGTWMLAGSAADQVSYESANIGHGMLTYSLLEAIDQASANVLRRAENGDLFVEVEGWFDYAVGRVESLKYEVGVSGVQRPQLARSGNANFPIGVMSADQQGFIGLKPPRPIAIVGQFDQDREDPLRIEGLLAESLRGDDSITVLTDVASHPRAFHLTGSYTQAEGSIKATVYLQYFGQGRDRKTLEKFEVEAKSAAELVALIGKRSLELMKTVKLPEPSKVKTGGG